MGISLDEQSVSTQKSVSEIGRALTDAASSQKANAERVRPTEAPVELLGDDPAATVEIVKIAMLGSGKVQVSIWDRGDHREVRLVTFTSTGMNRIANAKDRWNRGVGDKIVRDVLNRL